MNALISIVTRFQVRSLLIVSLLSALCISEGVGLQLLPIPIRLGGYSLPVESIQLKADSDSPTPPSGSDHISARIEITTQKVRKPSFQQEFVQLSTAALITNCLPDDLLQEIRPQPSTLLYSFFFASQPASRAPPRIA